MLCLDRCSSTLLVSSSMDPKTFFIDLVASCIIVLRRVVFLIVYPYKTMRQIAKESDDLQVAIIFLFVFFYYLFLPTVKPEISSPVTQFGLVLFNYLATVLFVYIFGRILSPETRMKPLLYLFAYSLIPTIIWFYMTSFLYLLLPPPRNFTILGTSFSVVFITVSVSLLAWKMILWYLAVRFGTKLNFYAIIFVGILYLAVVIPYSFYLYQFGFFRIPFL